MSRSGESLLLMSSSTMNLGAGEGFYLNSGDEDDRPRPREAFMTMAAFSPIPMNSIAEIANAHMRKIKELTDMRLALSKSANLKTIELTRLQHQLSNMKAEHKSLRAELKAQRQVAGIVLAASISSEAGRIPLPLPRAFSDMVSREEVTFDPLPESLQEELGDEYDQNYRYMIQVSQGEIISLQVNVNELDEKIAELSDHITTLAGKCDKVKSELAIFARQSAVLETPSVATQRNLPVLRLSRLADLTTEDRSALHLPRRVSLLNRSPAAPAAPLPQSAFGGRAAMFQRAENRDWREGDSVEAARTSSHFPASEL